MGGTITDDNAVPNAVMEVFEVLCTVIPNLAQFWLEGGRRGTRRQLMDRLMLELAPSGLNTCAYWLLVRLGKSSQFCRSGCFTLLTFV